jgi:uncharacterized protein YjbI with pentapeptide repeats
MPIEHVTPASGESWKANWMAQGMPWRTQPEIGEERQQFLSALRTTRPNYQRASYPFAGLHLDRADIEWLLATHEDAGVRGPVVGSVRVSETHDPPDLGGIDLYGVTRAILLQGVSDHVETAPDGEPGSSDPSDGASEEELTLVRWGLDLRGADLCDTNLSGLPLAFLWGGQRGDWWRKASAEERAAAAVRLERADLQRAFLQGSFLRNAALSLASLRGASLQCADLREAKLDGADLTGAACACTAFFRANLQGAVLSGAYVSRAEFRNANLTQADLSRTVAWGAGMRGAHLEQADLREADLRRADLTGASLRAADLRQADLRGAHLRRVQLEGANLTGADLSGAEGL